MLTYIKTHIPKLAKGIGYFISIVLLTVFAHWATVNAYVAMCAPPSFFGIFQTVISLGSPMCHFLNVTQNEIAKHYISLWAGAAIALTTWLAMGKSSKD